MGDLSSTTPSSLSAALEKLSGVLEEEPSVAEPVSPVPLHDVRGEVRFDQVRFEYVDGVAVLPGLDLTVPAGQTIALVGTTGAGKTTIAKLVSRFYDPVRGSVRLDGGLRTSMSRPAPPIVMVTREPHGGTVATTSASPPRGDDGGGRRGHAIGAHEFITAA
jgi:ABC-type transport system involved in cytochrome bd biosynthesis fused ATPase/permease subunit